MGDELMYTGSAVHCVGRNGIICAYLEDRARVQFLGAQHGPQWVSTTILREGWL